MDENKLPVVDFLQEHWRFESRPTGIYVAIEEIGGQGELGPFRDLEAARAGLLAYLAGDPPNSLPPPRT